MSICSTLNSAESWPNRHNLSRVPGAGSVLRNSDASHPIGNRVQGAVADFSFLLHAASARRSFELVTALLAQTLDARLHFRQRFSRRLASVAPGRGPSCG